MKTINDLFRKSASIKTIADFNYLSLSNDLMNSIKGGTQPIVSDPFPPTPPPPGSNNI